MSKSKRSDAGNASDYPCADCNLDALEKRSQTDFEIDFFERILNRDPSYTEVLMNLGELFTIKGWHRRALQVDRRLSELRPRDPLVSYNLACSLALLHQTEEAVAALRRAVSVGYSDIQYLAQDPDLDSIRGSAEFMRFMKDLQAIGVV